jgi:hypothetical protein
VELGLLEHTRYGVHKMIRIEHNVETGEVKEIELTASEIAELEAQYAKTIEENEIVQTKLAAKTAQRQALLDKLGITEDEARLLLGGN